MERLIFTPETEECRWVRSELAVPTGWVRLYRMFDRDGALLYVGITSNPIERWRTHSYRADWWCSVARIEAEDYPKEHLALAAEVEAIRSEDPLYNIRSAVR